jgi:trehalose 6-phosphate phosphatase
MTADALQALISSASEAGIFCDFDGCLSEIVDVADAARPVRGAREALERCAERFRVVAVVSGRTASDLERRIGARGVRLIGLHGMEEWRDGRVHASPEAEAARASVARAVAALARELPPPPEAVIEDKGLALSVHFRRAADAGEAERVSRPVVDRVAAAEGLAVVPGRRILEIRPATMGDKGDAVRRLVEEESLDAALVAGDDVGDLPAFRALDGLATGVRVAVASSEAPAELIGGADVVLGSPLEFVALLERLV